MVIAGADLLLPAIDSGGFFVKAILNERGMHFFPHTTEHRDTSLPGLSYKDKSQGNALAATIKPGRIDNRTHEDFSNERVQRIVQELPGVPDMSVLQESEIVYDGEPLHLSN